MAFESALADRVGLELERARARSRSERAFVADYRVAWRRDGRERWLSADEQGGLLDALPSKSRLHIPEPIIAWRPSPRGLIDGFRVPRPTGRASRT